MTRCQKCGQPFDIERHYQAQIEEMQDIIEELDRENQLLRLQMG